MSSDKEYSWDFEIPKKFMIDPDNIKWDYGYSKNPLASISVAFNSLGKVIETSLVSTPAFPSNWIVPTPKEPTKPCKFCKGTQFCLNSSSLWHMCSNCNAERVGKRWRISQEMMSSFMGKAVIAQWIHDNRPRNPRSFILNFLNRFDIIKLVYLVSIDGGVYLVKRDFVCNTAKLFHENYLLDKDGSVSQMDGSAALFVAWVPS